MRRVRLQRWSGQLLAARSGVAANSRQLYRPAAAAIASSSRRHQSTEAAAAAAPDTLAQLLEQDIKSAKQPSSLPSETLAPSPDPKEALKSAKLAALHARLSLSQKIPLQTLARSLVDVTADENPNFNNQNLAFLGKSLINYHVVEWLMCRFPRLPMMIVYSALNAYAGSKSLHQIARQWGIEKAAAPGSEVDPGLLQFNLAKERATLVTMGYIRPESQYAFKWRHGITSRVVQDDDFGDLIPTKSSAEDAGEEPAATEVVADRDLNFKDQSDKIKMADNIHADCVRAVVGSIYTHCGRETVKSFIRAHVLSRILDFESLFQFKLPTRELANLCSREGFEPPVARMLSETGRLSRTPVYVIGIYSGRDKLGEGAAPNPEMARHKAAINALKAWYLYSPGTNVRVPSDMLVEGAKPWKPAYVDIGEVI